MLFATDMEFLSANCQEKYGIQDIEARWVAVEVGWDFKECPHWHQDYMPHECIY